MANVQSSRRSFLQSLSALPLAGAAVAAPALSTPVGAAQHPHPDAALIEAGRAWAAAVEQEQQARTASTLAWDAYRDAVGPCPRELGVFGSEWELFCEIHRHKDVWRHPRNLPRFSWDFFADPDSSGQVWNVALLQASIEAARANLGPAGRMPKLFATFAL